MANSAISRLGLHFDEMNKVRVWDPAAATKTRDLDDACDNFVKKINSFDELAKNLITTAEQLAQHVDRQKMMALGASNQIMSMTKQREAQKQQYQSLILEKTTELERLRTQHQALLQTESEQQELLSLLRQS